MRIVPTYNQWKGWSLPSKLSAIGAYVGILSLCITCVILLFNLLIQREIQELREARYTANAKQQDRIIFGSVNEIIWGRELYQEGVFRKEDNEILHLNFSYKNSPEIISAGLNTPNGIKIAAHFENGYGVLLPIELDIGLGEFGELRRGYYLHICEHDFDNDSQPEILIAISDQSINLQINVLKYHPPFNNKDVMRDENWELIGNITSHYPTRAFVENSRIGILFGSQGLFEEFTFASGKFIQTQ